MKRFTRVCLIICGVLAGLGLMFSIIGICMGFGVRQIITMARDGAFNIHWGDNDMNFSFWDNMGDGHWNIGGNQEPPASKDSDWSSEVKTFSAADVKNLDVEFDFGTLLIESSASGNVETEVNYRSVWGNYNRKVDCTLDGDTLKIRDTVHKKILRLFSHGTEDAILTIRIPEGKVFEKVKLDVGAAYACVRTELDSEKIDITIGAGKMENDTGNAALLKANDMKLDIGAGQMALDGIETRKLDVECGAGQMDLSDVTAQDIDAECGIGQIAMSMNGSEKDYDYEIDCGIGQVVVGSSKYGGLGSSKSIRNGGSRRMNIECGIGEIEISFEQ